MLIFVDIDDVVWDLLKYWVEMLNEKYGLNVKVSDINNFDMRLFFPTLSDEEIYAPLKGSELWRRVRLKPNADTVIKRLMEEGHDIRFATATHYMNVKPKFEMLQFYLPFVSWDNVIVTRDKSILAGDVMIDDWKNNVINSRCSFKLLFDMPHNANVNCEENGLVRVYNWDDVYNEIHAIIENCTEDIVERQRLTARVQKLQLQKVVNEYKKQTAHQSCFIDVTDDVPDVLDNKIGGVPYIPVGEEYPMDKNGEPMALLLQINCKDINLPDYPKDGILEIFAPAKLSRPWDCVVKHYSENQAYRTDLPDIDLKDFICSRGYRIDTEIGTEYMSVDDYRCEPLVKTIIKQVTGEDIKDYSGMCDVFPYIDDCRGDFYDGVFQNPVINNSVTVGGYPDFQQKDIRPKEATGMDACLFKLGAYVDVFRSEGRFCIGDDGGVLCVLISEEDLKNQNFDNVHITWDC